jgi:hypothetical protein
MPLSSLVVPDGEVPYGIPMPPLIFLVPTRQRGNPVWTRQRPLDAGASELGSHAGAGEPEKKSPCPWTLTGIVPSI